jgi:UDP-N-acetylmuramoyl-tripeptide--D-alanyl-D-alanine ligase
VETEYFIPVLGAHNVTNALASIIVGEQFGVSVENRKKGLETLTITGMRNEVIEAPGGWTVINDAYNASPTSMRAALDLLESLTGYKKKIAVLGDMLELGDLEKSFHHGIGKYVQGKGFDYIFTFGELGMDIAKGAEEVMDPSRVKAFMNKQELTKELLPLLEPNDVIVVKGSRGMKLEEVVEGIS